MQFYIARSQGGQGESDKLRVPDNSCSKKVWKFIVDSREHEKNTPLCKLAAFTIFVGEGGGYA